MLKAIGVLILLAGVICLLAIFPDFTPKPLDAMLLIGFVVCEVIGGALVS